MLDQRRRRWADVVHMSYIYFVFCWAVRSRWPTRYLNMLDELRRPTWFNHAQQVDRIHRIHVMYRIKPEELYIPSCGSFPGLRGLKETKVFLPHLLVKLSNVGSLRDREVACSAADLQGLNFESCVWREVASHSFHHPHEVLLAQFSMYVHKSGLKPDSFHFLAVEKAEVEGSEDFNWLKTHLTIMRIPHNQQLGHTRLIIAP